MAYTKEFRTKIVEYFLEGYTRQELSALFNVGISSITKWTAVYRECGTTGGGYKKNWTAGKKIKIIDSPKFEVYVKEHPNATSREIAEAFSCSVETARKVLLRSKYKQKTEEEKIAFFSNYPKFYYER
ncbi:MAG: IS630 transposase-related protein [Chitinispirillales bacterium]|jgi:transposase|nr:IS630 transposase-related protein [Chitinispirillales bacterium]